MNNEIELFGHPEGRVIWKDNDPVFQYRLADHLGNTVVVFEDVDGDGLITSEIEANDPSELEVWQRQFYYPFGMQMPADRNSV